MSPKIRTWLKISKRVSIVSPNKETMSNIAGFHMSACDFNANYFHLHNTSRQPERRRMHDGWQRAVLLSHCDEQSLHQRDFSTRKCQVLQVISYLALAILNPSTTIEMYRRSSRWLHHGCLLCINAVFLHANVKCCKLYLSLPKES